AQSAYGDPVTLSNEWQRVSLTLTATAISRAVGIIGVPDSTFTNGDVIYIRNFQMEEKPYATTFINGTRANERLTIPTVKQGGAVNLVHYSEPTSPGHFLSISEGVTLTSG